GPGKPRPGDPVGGERPLFEPRLASRARLTYCARVRAALLPLVVVLGLAGAAVGADSPEQTVTPVAPGVEQRVEPVETGDVQRVEHLDPGEAQSVSGESKGQLRRAVCGIEAPQRLEEPATAERYRPSGRS